MAESSSSEDGNLLSGILRGSLVMSEFDKTPHGFVPQGTLDRIIMKDSILAAMEIDQPTREDDLLVDFILKRAKKVFAVSAFIELKSLRRAMLLFKDAYFDDTNLPIKDTLSRPSETNPSNGNPYAASGATQNILAFLEQSVTGKIKIWRPGKIFDFCKHQWKFLAPVFSTDKSNYYLEEAYIIPFVLKYADFGEGSFGQVSKYEIHPNHLKDPLKPKNPGHCVFAVKEIKPKNQKDRQKVARHWASETKALARMNTLNQDHIVRFITAFHRDKKDEQEHYLMFEWADGGNLRDLWREIPQPNLTASLVKAAIKQLLGLAEALCAAHYPNETGALYRHGNLKPANILRFHDGSEIGKLKIGDWGEAKEHNLVTELRTNETTAEYGTRRYEAPEVETGVRLSYLGQTLKRRSRLSDIWAMGCITLEFIVWLLYGLDELGRFNRSVDGELSDNSPLYQISNVNGKKVARVHSAAVRWMDHMARDPHCQVGATALGDLLELVREGLLVVKLPQGTGSTLSMDLDQPRVNPAPTQLGPETPSNASDASVLQIPSTSYEPPAAGIPSINVIPAEPVAESEPEPGPKGPARLLATGFRNRLEYILSSDEDESYWFTDQPRRPAPVSLGGLSSVPVQGGTDYDTEDMAEDMFTWRSPTDGQSNPPKRKANEATSAPSEADDSDTASTESSDPPSTNQASSTNPTSLSYEAAVDMEQVTERHSPMTFFKYEPPAPELKGDKEDDEIRSILSIEDEIESQAESSSGREDYRQAAVDYIVTEFTSDPELFALYRDGSQRMGEAKFVRNHRRLLKTLFLDLRSEGHIPSQKLAVEFLRSRRKRDLISKRIRNLVTPSDSTVREKIELMQQEKDKYLLLNRFLVERDFTVRPAPTDTAHKISDIASEGIEDSDDDDYNSNDESEAGMQEDNALSKLKATAEFLTSGRPFSLYKENLHAFLIPASKVADVQKNSQLSDSGKLEQSSRSLESTELEAVVPVTPEAGEEHQRGSTFPRKAASQVAFLPRGLAWLRKLMRPRVKQGYRRIEWQCDCGVDLYADFPSSYGAYIDKLAFSLQGPGPVSSCSAPSGPSSSQETQNASSSGTDTQETANKTSTGSQSSKGQGKKDQDKKDQHQKDQDPELKGGLSFLALCVNTGGIYKTLAEINMSGITSDAALFLEMRREYLEKRGRRSRFRFLIKPMTVEFIQFRLWNLRRGYISVCKRPNCIPPEDSQDYEYLPKSLEPPPMPPEVFIHYLGHGEGDMNLNRNDWLDPLPKRLKKRVMDSEPACYGYGMHVIEGPNREGIFWITIITMLVVILTSVLWSTFRNDVQGGTGLGALILAFHTAILTTFLFRLGGI